MSLRLFLRRFLSVSASAVVIFIIGYTVYTIIDAKSDTPLRVELLYRGDSCGIYELVHIGRGGNRWVANLDERSEACPKK